MKKHILIIDDEPAIREMLVQFLNTKGYRASTAESGAAAETVVQRDPPDLIITDMQMPDTDALALIDRLRQVLPRAPVLLLTGVLFDDEMVRENIGRRFDSYLKKTCSLQNLVGEVRRLLGEASS